eukprot:TRINITY_DN13859_c0_g1_i1.p2 TRINITY_DN13859_c0_g1~~TRINITY_DN13859_c0_g1_i1.p2  ORF type:complete len:208 (-),score=70.87 TRINITY_DN13859_c0_g1_i1:116-739(-)
MFRVAQAARSFPTAKALSSPFRTTTIVAVRKGNQLVMVGDKKVTQGHVACKLTARKLRRIVKRDQEDVLVGFAGSTADCFSLLQKMEGKLDEYPGQLLRACVELAKLWRSDKYLRRLEATLVVGDRSGVYMIDGMGNVIEADEDGIVSTGSGGFYARAAAKALVDIEGMTAEKIATKAIDIATEMDIYSSPGRFDMEKVEYDVKQLS